MLRRPLGYGGPGDAVRIRSEIGMQVADELAQGLTVTRPSATVTLPSGAATTEVMIPHAMRGTPDVCGYMYLGSADPAELGALVVREVTTGDVTVAVASNLSAATEVQISLICALR